MRENQKIKSKYFPKYMKGLEMCVVCDDQATGYHYCCITCEGCKGFFRRTVQRNLHETFRCKLWGRCKISRWTRNRCQACRFNKCLKVGMAIERVLDQGRLIAKRQLIEKNRRIRKCEEMMISIPRPNQTGCVLEKNDLHLIKEITKAHLEFLQKDELENTPSNDKLLPSSDYLFKALTRAITGVVKFAKAISFFTMKITLEDQVQILKSSCMEIIVLQILFNGVTSDNKLVLFPSVVVSKENLRQSSFWFCGNELFQLAIFFSRCQLSTTDKALLEAVLLFKERQSHTNSESLKQDHDVIVRAFQYYVMVNHPNKVNLHMQLLDKLSEVQALSVSFSEAIMKMKIGNLEESIFHAKREPNANGGLYNFPSTPLQVIKNSSVNLVEQKRPQIVQHKDEFKLNGGAVADTTSATKTFLQNVKQFLGYECFYQMSKSSKQWKQRNDKVSVHEARSLQQGTSKLELINENCMFLNMKAPMRNSADPTFSNIHTTNERATAVYDQNLCNLLSLQNCTLRYLLSRSTMEL